MTIDRQKNTWQNLKQTIGIIVSSVRLSVLLCIVAVEGRCPGLKVEPVQVPICPLRHFCCRITRMYRLATKRIEKIY